MLRADFFAFAAIFVLCAQASASERRGVPADVVRLACQFLESTDATARQALAAQLDASACDPLAVVWALRPEPAEDAKTGYFPAHHFRVPELRAKHPDDLLYTVVPKSYRPDTPTGLVVFMHGGGSGSKRTAPDRYMRMDGKGNALGNEFDRAGLIAVGPSAPWNDKCHTRWCLPEADDYIRDVILECQARYNIDPNRVVLMGHSMGGFGAYHQVQRQPDHFAAVISSAGSWYLACWPVIHGTPLWMVHGARDAQPGKRPHYTDVAFPREAHRLLTEQHVPHEYREHPDTHALDEARHIVREFLARVPKLRRDPCHPCVVCVTPRGWSASQFYPAPHNRWLSILGTTKGVIAYDHLVPKGPRQSWDMPIENWKGWQLVHSRRTFLGAMAEAVNQGDNRFDVTTRNVRRFGIWLHPRMVDLAKPVRVVVNGKLAFDAHVKPSVSAALRSFERRRDWGLIYNAELQIDVAPTAN